MLLLMIAGGLILVWAFSQSTYATATLAPPPQPVPFSHAHHVAGLGIDCRYCHSSVEQSAFAGMPSTDTCMNCHKEIWTSAELLAPVRESWRSGERIEWTRVYNVPDFVFFNHSVHVQSGIGCVTCHGRVDRMPLMYEARQMYMSFCLDCHRNPEQFVQPRETVFDMDWQPPPDREAMGRRLVEEYHIDTHGLTDCTACHR
ncbi:MAG: cytochrome c3 family protein [Phycisphaeraceae bacterium]